MKKAKVGRLYKHKQFPEDYAFVLAKVETKIMNIPVMQIQVRRMTNYMGTLDQNFIESIFVSQYKEVKYED